MPRQRHARREPDIVVSVAPNVGKFFPLAAGDALTGINADELLTAPQGAAVLLGYVAAFFVAGLLITKRSDVK